MPSRILRAAAPFAFGLLAFVLQLFLAISGLSLLAAMFLAELLIDGSAMRHE